MDSRLTALQREVLDAFFRRETHFFLTGGAALAGFYTGHRATLDLDLFTVEEKLDEAESALQRVAEDVGGTLERVTTAPDFRRRILQRGVEGVIVDLVRDRAPQIHNDKVILGALRIDPVDEILANKICALLSRSEIRDLVDVMVLERSGLSVEQAVREAAKKDAGLSPAQLGYVLSQWSIGEDARIPGATRNELVAYHSDLIARLARMAFPR